VATTGTVSEMNRRHPFGAGFEKGDVQGHYCEGWVPIGNLDGSCEIGAAPSGRVPWRHGR
jgi:hypothetical protein